MTPADVDAVRGRARVIAINDAHRLAPFADVLYACDGRWWNHYKGVPEFAGLKYGLTVKAGHWPGVQRLRNTGRTGLERDPSGVRTGMNSGSQAINLAIHFGARRILLLGYDMKRGTAGGHWFGEHPIPLRSGSPYGDFRACFQLMVEPLRELGVQVLNCSRDTALRAFPRVPLAEALAQIATVAA